MCKNHNNIKLQKYKTEKITTNLNNRLCQPFGKRKLTEDINLKVNSIGESYTFQNVALKKYIPTYEQNY